MKILLRKNIENVGKRGEIVEVADGYARNYLFPKNFALKPTPQNVKQLETEKRHHVQQEAEEKERMEQIGRRLREVSCTIVARADRDGHLYGSVTEAMIIAALAERNIKIEARHLRLEQHIKDLGVYNIPVRLHPEVESQLKVWVVEETEDGSPAEPADTDSEKSGEPADDKNQSTDL